MWAFGVYCWELATHGKTPYADVELANVQGVVAGGVRLQMPPGTPEPFVSVVTACWNAPDTRPLFADNSRQLLACAELEFPSGRAEVRDVGKMSQTAVEKPASFNWSFLTGRSSPTNSHRSPAHPAINDADSLAGDDGVNVEGNSGFNAVMSALSSVAVPDALVRCVLLKRPSRLLLGLPTTIHHASESSALRFIRCSCCLSRLGLPV